MLSWTPGNFTLDFGLVKTEQFSLQESFWGYRYILKSFDDEYKFGPSADMGIIGKYRFNDYISADLSFTNGEGYKKINKDNNYRYGAGVTLTPVTVLHSGYTEIFIQETAIPRKTSRTFPSLPVTGTNCSVSEQNTTNYGMPLLQKETIKTAIRSTLPSTQEKIHGFRPLRLPTFPGRTIPGNRRTTHTCRSTVYTDPFFETLSQFQKLESSKRQIRIFYIPQSRIQALKTKKPGFYPALTGQDRTSQRPISKGALTETP